MNQYKVFLNCKKRRKFCFVCDGCGFFRSKTAAKWFFFFLVFFLILIFFLSIFKKKKKNKNVCSFFKLLRGWVTLRLYNSCMGVLRNVYKEGCSFVRLCLKRRVEDKQLNKTDDV